MRRWRNDGGKVVEGRIGEEDAGGKSEMSVSFRDSGCGRKLRRRGKKCIFKEGKL
jgi:hypothetical protein